MRRKTITLNKHEMPVADIDLDKLMTDQAADLDEIKSLQ